MTKSDFRFGLVEAMIHAAMAGAHQQTHTMHLRDETEYNAWKGTGREFVALGEGRFLDYDDGFSLTIRRDGAIISLHFYKEH